MGYVFHCLFHSIFSTLYCSDSYLKEFAYRGEGKHVEIWVALGTHQHDDCVLLTDYVRAMNLTTICIYIQDVAFPWGDEDCRNTLILTQIGDEQLQSVIDEFDSNICKNRTLPQVMVILGCNKHAS